MMVFNVFNEEPYIGKFYQGSFSTRELAQAFIDSAPKKMQKTLSIKEHAVDSVTTEGWERLM